MSKTAIVVLSEPQAGSDEALGRVFNAMAAAYEFNQSGEDVRIVFQGAGTRWPKELQKVDHPGNKLYKEIEGLIDGISAGCANVFGAEASGLDLLTDYKLPGTNGVASYLKLHQEGYSILNF